MNRRLRKKINKRLTTYVSVHKKKPPKEQWIVGDLSNGAGGYPIYIEKDGTMFYRTVCGRVEISKDVKLLCWKLKH